MLSSACTLPPELKDQLEEPVERLVKRAKSRLQRAEQRSEQQASASYTRRDRSGGNSIHGAGTLKRQSGQTIGCDWPGEFGSSSALELAAADAGESEAFKKIVRACRQAVPGAGR